MAVRGSAVYWSDATGTIEKVPLGGRAPIVLASSQADPVAIAVPNTSIVTVLLPSLVAATILAVRKPDVAG